MMFSASPNITMQLTLQRPKTLDHAPRFYSKVFDPHQPCSTASSKLIARSVLKSGLQYSTVVTTALYGRKWAGESISRWIASDLMGHVVGAALKCCCRMKRSGSVDGASGACKLGVGLGVSLGHVAGMTRDSPPRRYSRCLGWHGRRCPVVVLSSVIPISFSRGSMLMANTPLCVHSSNLLALAQTHPYGRLLLHYCSVPLTAWSLNLASPTALLPPRMHQHSPPHRKRVGSPGGPSHGSPLQVVYMDPNHRKMNL